MMSENALGQSAKAVDRDRQPRGAVRRLVAELVGGLLDQEEIEKLDVARGSTARCAIGVEERALAGIAQLRDQRFERVAWQMCRDDVLRIKNGRCRIVERPQQSRDVAQ